MADELTQPFGRVVGLAVCAKSATPLEQRDAINITVEQGIEGDHGTSKKRGITLLSKSQWEATLADLGLSQDELPWTTRRANVLIDAPTLAPLIGQTIQLGDVSINIRSETHPCSLMDEQHIGLMQALEPDCRGGVYGSILCDGAIQVGDAIAIAAESAN